jgi:hypothetical protein
MTEPTSRDRLRRARRRALRAAQVVTLSAALGGCAVAVELAPEPDAAPPPTDAGRPVADAGPPDGGPADAGVCDLDLPIQTEDCCDELGGWWEGGDCVFYVEGPRLPPAMA